MTYTRLRFLLYGESVYIVNSSSFWSIYENSRDYFDKVPAAVRPTWLCGTWRGIRVSVTEGRVSALGSRRGSHVQRSEAATSPEDPVEDGAGLAASSYSGHLPL